MLHTRHGDHARLIVSYGGPSTLSYSIKLFYERLATTLTVT